MSALRAVQIGQAPAPVSRPTRGDLRAEIEAAITASLDAAHRLILLLDAVDADPDAEPEEPDDGSREWCGEGVQRFDVGAAA